MEIVNDKDAAARSGKKDLSVLEMLQVPLFVADQDGKLVYGNKAFADLVGVRQEQLEGVPVGSLIQSESSGMKKCLETGSTVVVESWAMIGDKKHFFEYMTTPTLDSKGKVRGIIETIIDRTGQKLVLQAVQDLVARAKAGDLTAKASVKMDGDYQLIVDHINEMLESMKGVIGEVQSLTAAITAGDLTRRGNENEFQGAYREIILGMNGLIESVADPLSEIITVLNRLGVNDCTQKIVKDYPGVWDELKNSTNAAVVNVRKTVSILGRISKGDMSDLAFLKKTGGLSENDELIPIGATLIESLMSVIEEITMLAGAAVEGRLSARADVAKHQGEYRKIIEGFNATLDAMLLPVNEASACLQEMAGGNLDVEMKGDYKGDHAVIKENLNATLASLNDILNQVSGAVDQMTTGARQVSDSSQSLSQGATESASSLEEISASMHELTSQTNMNAENATQASQLAVQAKISAEKGDAEMGNMVRAMNDINESASSISKIIKAIDEIAFQTNLLALNAAVEAARAGKHGKGFTVVAEEVRNLAQRSAGAARETAAMIEGSIKKTEADARTAEETSKALEEIVAGSTKVTDLIAEIAAASKEQAQGIGQINTGLAQVDQVTQQVTANAEESASASEELSSQSLQLKSMLSKFRLRKKELAATASGLPEGITPEMIRMLRELLKSQQLAAASGVKPGRSAGRPPVKAGATRGGAAVRPSDIIALDDKDFGGF